MSKVEKDGGIDIAPLSSIPFPRGKKVDISQLTLYAPLPISEDILDTVNLVHSGLGLNGGIVLKYSSLDIASAAMQRISDALRNSKAVPHYTEVIPFFDEESGTEQALLTFVHPSYPGINKQESEG